jgi:NADPH2:quinone reductase
VRAVVVQAPGGPEVLELKDSPEPTPGAGELLVRVAASGVNFIDVYKRTGLYPVPLPFVAGDEGAGTVEVVGEGVSEFAAGDRVAWAQVQGSYAELVAVPAASAVPVPDGVEDRTAAALMLQGMTAHYLTHTTYPVTSGDTVLVHAGAGGVGLLLTQMAKRRGARVITTVSTAGKEELSRGAGADEVIRYTETDFVQEVRRLTDGKGVEVVYDSVGRTTFSAGLDCLRPRGMMVLYGGSSGPVEPFNPMVLNAKGSLFLTRPSLGAYVAQREELLSRAGDVLAWAASGELDVRIGGTYPLADAGRAHGDLEARRTTGKLLLSP